MSSTDLSWPLAAFDPLLTRIFLPEIPFESRPSAADVEEFLSLGFELCQTLLLDFFDRTVGTPTEAYLNYWALFGSELHYALPEGQRDLCLALCFQVFRTYSKHTDWHPWDGQFTVFEGNEDLEYRKAFFRHFCIDAVMRGSLQGFQNWFGDSEQLLNVLATELSPPLRLLFWKFLCERDDQLVIETVAEEFDIHQEEARARLDQVLQGSQDTYLC